MCWRNFTSDFTINLRMFVLSAENEFDFQKCACESDACACAPHQFDATSSGSSYL